MMLPSFLRRRTATPPPSDPPPSPVRGIMVCGGDPRLLIDGEWVPALPVAAHEIRWRLQDGTGVATYYRHGAKDAEWKGRDAGRKAQEHAMFEIQRECDHLYEVGKPCCMLCAKPHPTTPADEPPFSVKPA